MIPAVDFATRQPIAESNRYFAISLLSKTWIRQNYKENPTSRIYILFRFLFTFPLFSFYWPVAICFLSPFYLQWLNFVWILKYMVSVVNPMKTLHAPDHAAVQCISLFGSCTCIVFVQFQQFPWPFSLVFIFSSLFFEFGEVFFPICDFGFWLFLFVDTHLLKMKHEYPFSIHYI